MSAHQPLPKWFGPAEQRLLRVFTVMSDGRTLLAVLLPGGAAGTSPIATRVVAVGIAIMAITPFLRLALMAAAFVQQRDRVYASLALVVLGVLIASLCGSIG